jgi:predicted Zn-dependent protease
VGAEILRRAGWDARGMIEFMQILDTQARHNPGRVETFFSTHPSPTNRLALLRQTIPRLRGGRRDSAEFRSMKARLRQLPPAQRMPRS